MSPLMRTCEKSRISAKPNEGRGMETHLLVPLSENSLLLLDRDTELDTGLAVEVGRGALLRDVLSGSSLGGRGGLAVSSENRVSRCSSDRVECRKETRKKKDFGRATETETYGASTPLTRNSASLTAAPSVLSCEMALLKSSLERESWEEGSSGEGTERADSEVMEEEVMRSVEATSEGGRERIEAVEEAA